MKSRTLTLTAIAFALLLGVATTQAQSQRLSASIPFDFQVGSEHMPAGQYVIASDGFRLTIQGLHTTGAAFVQTSSIGSKHLEAPQLVFVHRGDQYYLTQVWSSVLHDGRGIQLPKDRRIEAHNRTDYQETVVAMH